MSKLTTAFCRVNFMCRPNTCADQSWGTPGANMSKRRIIRRKSKTPAAASRGGFAVPMTKESFGLKPDAECKILIVGGPKYCSFTLARLGRLGVSTNIGITNSETHAIWAVKNLEPKIVIASVDHERVSGGIDLMSKLQAINPNFMVIVTSSALDVSLDGRSLRDLAWGMNDSWSFVTRRRTDNGDPLGIAVITAQQGVGWIDYPVRKQLEQWRTASSKTPVVEVPVAA